MRKLLFILLTMSSCLGDLADCDSKADVMHGVWKIKEIYIDGLKEDASNYANYRLNLKDDGTYERRQPSGFPDSGTWLLSNQEQTVVLQPNISPEEQYVLEAFTLREMTLVLNRASTKAGPSQIRYVLIPDLE